MLKVIIGPEQFRAGMDLYLSRCDGTAATIEDFLPCFAEVSGHDLSHFAKWYEQAGTPRLSVTSRFDAATETYRLDFTQETAPTPGQPNKEPMVIPVALGLIGADGGVVDAHVSEGTLTDGVFLLTTAKGALVFSGVKQRPVASLLRGFSAPVRLETDLSDEDLLVLFRHDTDSFNRWQAGQTLAMRMIIRGVEATRAGEDLAFDPRFADALGHLLASSDDHAFVAQVFALPSESDIAREIVNDIDPDAIFNARRALRASIGARLADQLGATHDVLATPGPYSPDAASAGRRSLRNAVLDLLAMGVPERGSAVAQARFEAADNMSDRIGALAVLAQLAGPAREEALAAFEMRYANDALVMDKWFALQASIPEPATLERVQRLMQHPGFSMNNPNRVRSLIGAFASGNVTQFNRADGAGFEFVAGIVIALDRINPQVAARLLGAFKTWRALEVGRRERAKAALEKVAAVPNLSPDVGDIVTRALG